MQLYKNLAVQIVLLISLVYWNIVIGFRADGNWITAVALCSSFTLLVLIPLAATIKNREDWNDFFAVFMLILYPLHSYFIIEDLHANLLYESHLEFLMTLWIPYLLQSVIITNYLVVYLRDYYHQYTFYGITSLSILNHGLVLSSLTIIFINSFQYLSDHSKLNELIATEIKPGSVKVSEASRPFFNYYTNDYTIKVESKNSEEFLLPIRERVIMEYQRLLFESNYIEKTAFSNEILFKSPTDTFEIEIIQSF